MQSIPKHFRLPDPWCPLWPMAIACNLGAGNATYSTGALTANKAYYVPVIVPVSATLYSLSVVVVAGTTGNYDLGVYNSDLTARIASLGSTAVSSAGIKTFTFPSPIRVHAGDLIYAAAVCSSGTPTFARIVANSVADTIHTGMGIESSALPLPDPPTPLKTDSSTWPALVFGVR